MNEIMGTIDSAAVAVLIAIIGYVGNKLVQFIGQKKSALASKMGVAEYNHKLSIAKQCWKAVDEIFRITPELTKTQATATAHFAALMKERIPGLTDDEIKQLQAVVAGEINAGRTAVEAAAPEVSVSAVSLPADTADTDAKSIDITAQASQTATAPATKTA